jgi:hypothetical protein
MKMDLDRRVAKGEITEKDRKKILEDMRTKPGFEYEINPLKFGGANFADEKVYKEAKDKKRQELDAEVLAGRMTRKTADSELAGFDKVSFWAEKIDKEVDSRVAAGFITKEDGEKIKKDAPARIQHQFQEFEAAELAKKNEQYSKREGTYKKREEAVAEQHLWHDQGYKQREAHINEMSHDMQQIQAQTSTDKELSLLTQIRNLLERSGEKNRAIDLAKLTSSRDIGKLQNEKQSLEIRAEAARQNKQDTFAGQLQQQADSLIFNKISEGFKNAGLSDNERAFQAAAIAEKQKKIYENAATQGRTSFGQLTTAEKEELQNYTRQKMALTTVNAGAGAYAAQRDMATSLHAIGWKDPFTEENQLRRWLSAQLGRVVNKGEETQAQSQLQDILGPEEYKASLRHMAINAKKQISEGNRDFILFDEDLDKATGRTQYSVDMKPEASGKVNARKEKIINTLYGWRAKKDLKVSSMREAMGDRQLEADGTGTQLVAIDDDNSQFNASLLAGATSQTISRLEGGLLGDINNANLKQVDLERQLKDFAKVLTDKEAFRALGKQLKKQLEKYGINEAGLDDMFKKVKDAEKNTAAGGGGTFTNGAGI